MFIGFGAGHFYIGDKIFGLIKLFVQIFLCVLFYCVTYFACNREHTFQASPNEMNNNENIAKNILNENKNDNNENKGNENDENIDDNDSNENKNDSKNHSFELDENRDDEIMMKNFIKFLNQCLLFIFLVLVFCYLKLLMLYL